MIVLRSDSGETHVRRHATWGMYVYETDRHLEAIEALRRRDEEAVAAAIGADIRDGIGGFGRTAIANLLRIAGN